VNLIAARRCVFKIGKTIIGLVVIDMVYMVPRRAITEKGCRYHAVPAHRSSGRVAAFEKNIADISVRGKTI
jgi:hypothetical protein